MNTVGVRGKRARPVRSGAPQAGPGATGAQQVRPVGYTPRRDLGLRGYERVLARAGLSPVAGVDEAGRGACAGPLVVAAVILKPSKIASLTDLDDSKALTAKARNAVYRQIMGVALDWSVVTIPAADIDRLGLHVCNVAGMRRALAALKTTPEYVLTDGFPVRGLAAPTLAMWKGDQVAACVAAASVVAKVTRDAMMCELDKIIPNYGFARHKGYSTRSHMRALDELGPSAEHRRSFVNVRGRLITGLEPDPDELMEEGLQADQGDLEVDLEQGPGSDVEPGLEPSLEYLAPGQGLVDAGIGPA